MKAADFVNEQEYWAGGVKPKVEVWLSADSDCYFPSLEGGIYF